MVTSSIAIETRHKVLLVDDDAVSLELMSLLLAHEGHQVVSAGNAGAAMHMLAQNKAGRPDVLLVDLHMPDISGDQLAAKVRALRHSGRCPLLLAMSATAADSQQLAAFDGFLLKPFALEDFRQALNPKKRMSGAGIRMVHRRDRTPDKPSPASHTATVTNAVDMAVITKLLTMMPETALEQVLTACLADTRACIATLQSEVQNGTVTNIRETAHRIKGAALMVGATRVAGLAAGLEAGGDQQAATQPVLLDLLKACNEVEGMLLAGKFKNSQGPPP